MSLPSLKNVFKLSLKLTMDQMVHLVAGFIDSLYILLVNCP
jgi:hypothetical protein